MRVTTLLLSDSMLYLGKCRGGGLGRYNSWLSVRSTLETNVRWTHNNQSCFFPDIIPLSLHKPSIYTTSVPLFYHRFLPFISSRWKFTLLPAIKVFHQIDVAKCTGLLWGNPFKSRSDQILVSLLAAMDKCLSTCCFHS